MSHFRRQILSRQDWLSYSYIAIYNPLICAHSFKIFSSKYHKILPPVEIFAVLLFMLFIKIAELNACDFKVCVIQYGVNFCNY